jgi:multidrug efflux pump
LILSQLLTLYTTPVVYLSLDRLRSKVAALRARGRAPERSAPDPVAADPGKPQ